MLLSTQHGRSATTWTPDRWSSRSWRSRSSARASASLGWAVVADTSPKQIAGLSGGLFNTFGNTAAHHHADRRSATSCSGPRSFNGALVFVAANALTAIVAYLFVVGEIRRVELQEL